MKNKIALYDIIFYVAVPLIVWKFGRGYLGEYYAMLLSSVPGILYSVYRFYEVKKLNTLGLFMLINLLMGTFTDVIAAWADDPPIQLLWNKVYYLYALGVFFLVTVLINKPITMYFAVDVAELQGSNREELLAMYREKKVLTIFKWITFGFAFRDFLFASIKVWLISEYGVDAFTKGMILRQALNWGMTLIFAIGFVYIAKITGTFSMDDDKEEDEKK